ncbi:MAG: ABC transporter permease [Gammaproteobacteria bacterium]|nr:ABC transporter permease [Gammaproteobacteria bacterium]
MNRLRLSGWRHLRRHGWQSVLSVFGISLGVAVVMAVDLSNQSANRAFELSMEEISGRSSHHITTAASYLNETLYRDLRLLHGIRKSAPVIEGIVEIRGEQFTLLGLDPLAEQPFRQMLPTVGDSGIRKLLSRTNALILAQSSARRLHIEQDQWIDLEVAGRPIKMEVAGLAGETDNGALDGLVLVDIATAQTLLQRKGQLDRIDLVLQPDEAAALLKILPDGVRLEAAGRRSEVIAQMSSAFQTNLSAMSLLALLVGGFLIYNAMTFSVLQRRNLLGMLRQLGVSRREIFFQVMSEALLIGVAGTLLGIVAGYLLGQGLVTLVARTINDLYFTLRVTELSVTPESFLIGTTLGIVATLIAAFLPALEATRVTPVAASRRSVIELQAHRIIPWLVAAGVGLVSVGVLLLFVPSDSLALGFGALFLMITGYSLLVPGLVVSMTHILRSPLTRWAGFIGRLAIRGISASLSRTGLAVAALTLAIATTVGMGIMTASFRTTVSDWLHQTLQGDIYVTANAQSSSRVSTPLPPALIQKLPRLQGIEEVSLGRNIRIDERLGPVRLLAIQMASASYHGFSFKGKTLDALWQRFHRGEAMLVSEPYAYRRNLSIGDSISLPVAGGSRSFIVGGIFFDYGTDPGLLVLPLNIFQQHWKDKAISTIGIYLQDGYPADKALTAVRQILGVMEAKLKATPNRKILEHSLEVFDRTFTITRVLRLLVIAVAFVGILSAFLALQLERSVEYAILRATGLTPTELLKLVTLQTGILGLMAGLFALPLGWLMGEVLIDVINLRSFGWSLQSIFPPGLFLEAILLSLGAALLAGIYPGVRLARSAPAAAMRTE